MVTQGFDRAEPDELADGPVQEHVCSLVGGSDAQLRIEPDDPEADEVQQVCGVGRGARSPPLRGGALVQGVPGRCLDIGRFGDAQDLPQVLKAASAPDGQQKRATGDDGQGGHESQDKLVHDAESRSFGPADEDTRDYWGRRKT